MDVNYEVWGNPEEWQDISDYSWANLAECKIPKSGRTSYYRAYDAGALQGGEVPTDLSLAYWGIGEGSILAHPVYLSPYWDGDTIKTAVNEVQEPKSVPCILNWASDPSGTQADMTWTYRYAPTDTPGQDSWRAQNLIATTAYSRRLIASFNYQKVYLIPYVKVAAAGSSSWGRATLSLKEYMDGMTDGGSYVSYDKVIGIGYQIAIGDGIDSNRSTGNKEMGIVFPVSFEASQRSYQSGSRTYTWFATRYGIEALMTNFSLNYYTHSLTPYREWNSEDFSGQHLVGDADTGWRRKYCQNYYAGGNIYGQVPIYYYNPDDEIWKVNNSTPWNTNYADPFPYIECTPTTKDAVKDYIMKQIAYLGFPFMYDPALADRGQIGDNGVYLPEFNEEGITTGNYAEGRAALRLPNSEWVDGRTGSGYDPTSSDGPTPSGNPMLPVGLEFTLADNGTGIWALTPSNIYEVLDDIFGSKMKAEVFGNNPMNAILSLKWTPFEWTPGGTQDVKPVVLGNQVVNPLHSYPMIKTVSQAEKHGYGTIKFNFDKNFYNARNMQARLFLPFYGYYALPTAQLLSSELRVDFYYDVPDELGVYVISYNDVIYDFVECSIDIDVPLTGSNAAAISQSKRAEALQIATQVASTALTTMAFVGTGGLSGVSQFISMSKDAGSLVGGLQSLPYLYEAAPREAINQVAGLTTAATLTGGTATGIAGAITNGKIQRANLRTNLPYHGSALQTTFLHMSMKPYVQIFKNTIMSGLTTQDGGTVKVKLGGEDEAQYKLKVGHACDVWKTVNAMPDNSLLQATGLADTDTTGMELSEVQELNAILQSGFFK